MLRGYRYPRAHIVIQAVRQAYELAWTELGETKDACCLTALADALEGVSREASAHKTGVSLTEISRRRREAVDMIIDHVLALVQEEHARSQALRAVAPADAAGTDVVSPPAGPLLAGIPIPSEPSFEHGPRRSAWMPSRLRCRPG